MQLPASSDVQKAIQPDELDVRARSFARHSRAQNTWHAYGSDWTAFVTWCEARGEQTLPAAPATVVRYVTSLAERYKVSTIQRRLAAISAAHELAGHPSPARHEDLRLVMKGIRREKGVAPQQKAPVMTHDLRRMIATVDLGRLIGLRDRALLLVGFAGAFRRSELVSLNVGDVQFSRDGLVVTLRQSKTDQEKQGTQKGLPYGSNPLTCPVRALEDWLRAAGLEGRPDRPLFLGITRHGHLLDRLSDRGVARVVQRCAQAAGLDPAQYAGHSLRAGMATSAAEAGASDSLIAEQTGHRSMEVLRRYIRRGKLFTRNAASVLGL